MAARREEREREKPEKETKRKEREKKEERGKTHLPFPIFYRRCWKNKKRCIARGNVSWKEHEFNKITVDSPCMQPFLRKFHIEIVLAQDMLEKPIFYAVTASVVLYFLYRFPPLIAHSKAAHWVLLTHSREKRQRRERNSFVSEYGARHDEISGSLRDWPDQSLNCDLHGLVCVLINAQQFLIFRAGKGDTVI